jgi:hypothetical protein
MSKRIETSTIVLVGAVIVVGLLMMTQLWPTHRLPPVPLDVASFEALCEGAATPGWHVAVYLDMESCLYCNEELGAWRELGQSLLACGGAMSLWAPLADSVDVVVAMELEGMNGPVRTADPLLVESVRRSGIGTPVKVLLDNQCRATKFAGWMGNKRKSRCFIEGIIEEIEPGRHAAVASF